MQKVIKKVLLAGFSLSIVLGISACADKSNMIPPKPLVEFKQTQSLEKLWRVNIGDGTDEQYYVFAPVLSKGIVYTVSSDGEVNAINATTGKRLWDTSLPETLGATPGVGDNKVFVGSISGVLYALSQKDGHIMWKVPLASSLYAQPVYDDGIVVVHLHNGEIAAFNAADGKLVWKHTANLPEIILVGNSAPLINNGVVYIGLDNGEVWAMELKTGKRLWERPVALPTGGSIVARMIDIEGAPLIDNNVLYAATFQGRVAAINLENASLIWSRPISTYVSLAISDNQLLASTYKGYLNAYGLSDGNVLWSQKDLEGRQISAPAIINGQYVAVGDFEGYLHIFDLKTGKYAARYDVGGDGIRAEPVTVLNRIYVQTNNGYLYAFKLGN
ncbi:outer membrane protein assembly factor BamB [Thiotrichales bacterium 19S3-7]|nr:outer membrane protein assembly factor BamB [Thiotrichales bacterium 19S3-7]MCF6801763.1 outer membrane protein assembly factor BamB [Thiotrichales bacterium 19S3-11]